MAGLEEYKGVWVYAQHADGQLPRPVLEILAAGRKVANKLGEKLTTILIGADLNDVVRQPIEYGADEVIACEDSRLKEYLCLPYSTVLTNLVLERKPNIFLFVADEVGRDLAPRLAYKLKTGLATDNIELEIEDFFYAPSKTTYKNLLIQIRPDFATRVAKIYTPRHRPQIATVRPGNFAALPRDPSKMGSVYDYRAKFEENDFAVIVKEVKRLSKSRVDLEGAQAIVSLGLGILRDRQGNPRDPLEGYNLGKELANAISDRFGFRTEMGSSRALIYAELKELHGVISLDNQVGQTGKTVSPEIYFALGISGAVQHRVGMLRSKRIVAVNLDPNSPIFQIAHYPIVGDVYEEVPKLIEEIRRA